MSTSARLLCLVAVLTSVASGAGATNYEVTISDNSGAGSLRAAIESANLTAGSDTITFDPSVTLIAPLTELPNLEEDITLDGGGVVTLDGVNIVGLPNGVFASGNNNTIAGLTIVRFGGKGVYLTGNGNTVRGCLIGIDGVTPNQGNGGAGITVSGSNNIVGGATAADRNVISGNGYQGVLVLGDTASGNQVIGNYIGTDLDGALGVGNGQYGVFLASSANNVVGAPGKGNLISGNGADGVIISNDGASGNLVQSNIIGLSADGVLAIPNAGSGVAIYRGSNTVGGTGAGAGNTICGNLLHGIIVSTGDAGIVIQGNSIGLAPVPNGAVGNGIGGILVQYATNSQVGGPSIAARNIILGNIDGGIHLINADNARVQGNYIGVPDSGANTALGVQALGIVVEDSAGVIIGGTSALAANTIAYHSGEGIVLSGTLTQHCTIRYNSIHSNGAQGINLTGSTNSNLAAPTIDAINPIVGTVEAPSATIELFVDDGAQGRTLIDVVQSSVLGAFSSTVDLSAYNGLNLTATVTTTTGDTSEFSAPVAIQLNHVADQNGDNVIGLSELLRVIQFYNSGGYHCEGGTEDDFAPGAGAQTCTPHTSDYAPQNWIVSLSELLRLIQFYNSGGYHPCAEGEDGYCPGV